MIEKIKRTIQEATSNDSLSINLVSVLPDTKETSYSVAFRVLIPINITITINNFLIINFFII